MFRLFKPNIEKMKKGKKVNGLIKILKKDKDPILRKEAAKALGEIGDDNAIETLTESLKDVNNEVKMSCVNALGRIDSKKVFEVVSKIFDKEEQKKDIYKFAALVLGRLKDPRGMEKLIELINKDSYNLRCALGEVFLGLGNIAVKPLLEAYDKSYSSEQKRRIISFLKNTPDKRVIELLLWAQKSKDSYLRLDATTALEKMIVAGYIRNPIHLVKYLINKGEWKEVEKFGIAAIPVLCETLKQDINEKKRRLAARSLGNMKSSRAVSPLIEAFKDTDINVREEAAKALGKIGPSSLRPVLSAFNNSDEKIRKTAALALGNIGGQGAFENIKDTLKDKSDNVRLAAIEAMGELMDKRSIEPLIEIIEDNKSIIRAKVCKVLGKLKDKKALEHLIKRLNDQDRRVREEAIQALVLIKDPKCSKDIQKLLHDKDLQIQKIAARAIDAMALKMDSKNKADYLVAKRNWNEIVLMGTEATDAVINSLKDKDQFIRRDAACCLGRINDKKAVMALCNLMQKDESYHAREAAARALGMIKDPRALAPLMSAINDKNKNVRQSAVLALGKIKDKKAVDILISNLVDSKEYIRGSSIWALGEIGDTKAIAPLIRCLEHHKGNVRKASAKALKEIYKKGINQKEKLKILSVRNIMSAPHEDRYQGNNDCTPHTDIGVGVSLE